MKKTLALILLGFITLNTNLFCMEKKSEKLGSVETTPQIQFTKKDYLKVGLASITFALIASAAISSPYTITAQKDKWYMLPALVARIPLWSFAQNILKCKNNRENDNITIGITGVLSAFGATGLGLYVYKKLSALRSNTISNSKKVVQK